MVTSRILLIVSIVVLFPGDPAQAQDPILEIGTVEVIPNQVDVRVPIALSTDDEVHGVDIGISYASNRLTCTSVDLDIGALADLNPQFTSVDVATLGDVTILIALDSISPFTTVLPAEDDQVIAELLFDVDNFQFSGTESEIEFVDGLGDPEVTNQVYVDGDAVVPLLIDGAIVITDANHIVLPSFSALPGTSDIDLSVVGFNVEEIQGYQVAFSFDPDYVQIDEEISIEDTIAESEGAEFVVSSIDNDEGTAVLGVLLDLVPPFDAQSISAAGVSIDLGFFTLDLLDVTDSEQQTVLELTDGLGSPPIDNIFVIDGSESTYPVKVDGVINIILPLEFVRMELNGDGIFDISDAFVMLNYLYGDGVDPDCVKACDANDSGSVNILDPIYALDYLFGGGEDPPAPFPEPGLDPTSDSLPCLEQG